MTVLPPELVVLAPPVYFLSDAHLGAARGEIAQRQYERLGQIFAQISRDAKTLVIAGDLFDFWYEWSHVIPKQHFGVLRQLRQLVDQHIAVHYLAGNHDFRLHGFLETEIGARIHPDHLAAEINGQRIFVYHGDGVLGRDHGYRMLKKVLRNRVAQRAFSWLHPDLGMALASGTSKSSRSMDHGGPEDDRDYLAFAQRKFAEGYHGVVMGHTHRPVEHREGSHTYVNLGDWILHFTYGLHDGNRLSLQQWSETRAAQAAGA